MKRFSRSEVLKKLPTILLKRLQEQFGVSEFEQILRGFAADRLPVIRLNPLAGDPEETVRALRSQNILLQKIPGLPAAYQVQNRSQKDLRETVEALAGKFLLQGISSQLPVLFLEPQAGEKIWDMCAAPGSKTSQIAALTLGKATIIASEKDALRFQKLQNTLRIQKCAQFVQVYQADALRLGKQFENAFDAVLLDAPCSAEGRIDLGNPASYRFWSEKNITAHAKLQRQLFRAAWKSLKKGGRLLYSTCTLAPPENEGVVEWALGEFQEGITQIPLSTSLSFVRKKDKSLYVIPDQAAEGFFLAKFVKRG